MAPDAPLIPSQLERLSKRVPLGIGRVGGIGGIESGDLSLAFSAANREARMSDGVASVRMDADGDRLGAEIPNFVVAVVMVAAVS